VVSCLASNLDHAPPETSIDFLASIFKVYIPSLSTILTELALLTTPLCSISQFDSLSWSATFSVHTNYWCFLLFIYKLSLTRSNQRPVLYNLRMCNLQKMNRLCCKQLSLLLSVTFTGMDKHTSLLWNPDLWAEFSTLSLLVVYYPLVQQTNTP